MEISLSLGLHKGRPSYRTLKREHTELQNKKFLKKIVFLGVIFALLDPDLDSDSESKSTNLVESISIPDPKH